MDKQKLTHWSGRKLNKEERANKKSILTQSGVGQKLISNEVNKPEQHNVEQKSVQKKKTRNNNEAQMQLKAQFSFC